MIPIVEILADELPNTLSIKTLTWALNLGACLGGNGTYRSWGQVQTL